jgi:hypothetical protein
VYLQDKWVLTLSQQAQHKIINSAGHQYRLHQHFRKLPWSQTGQEQDVDAPTSNDENLQFASKCGSCNSSGLCMCTQYLLSIRSDYQNANPTYKSFWQEFNTILIVCATYLLRSYMWRSIYNISQLTYHCCRRRPQDYNPEMMVLASRRLLD